MSLRKRSTIWYVEVRWKGIPRIVVSTRSRIKARAQAIERTLIALRDQGRTDLLTLLAERKIDVVELHDRFVGGGRDELTQLKQKAESPLLGDLVGEWETWMRSPAGVSPRTRKRLTPATIKRYLVSWEGFFDVLPKGRQSRLSDLNRGFLLDYRVARKKATGGKWRKRSDGEPSGATINRDLAALGSFMTWVADIKELEFVRPRLPREREAPGRERWLSSEELSDFRRHCPKDHWPFFALLFYAGMRLGEAQALRGGDVLISARRIQIHPGRKNARRNIKSVTSNRDVPISPPLLKCLAEHLARVSPGPSGLVFPDWCEKSAYGRIRGVWDRTCRAAGIEGATPHDARHTFAVHAAQQGVPIVRLQKLLGHATALMTMRYMRHAPEQYMDEDGSLIAASLDGTQNSELEARTLEARKGIKRA